MSLSDPDSHRPRPRSTIDSAHRGSHRQRHPKGPVSATHHRHTPRDVARPGAVGMPIDSTIGRRQRRTLAARATLSADLPGSRTEPTADTGHPSQKGNATSPESTSCLPPKQLSLRSQGSMVTRVRPNDGAMLSDETSCKISADVSTNTPTPTSPSRQKWSAGRC